MPLPGSCQTATITGTPVAPPNLTTTTATGQQVFVSDVETIVNSSTGNTADYGFSLCRQQLTNADTLLYGYHKNTLSTSVSYRMVLLNQGSSAVSVTIDAVGSSSSGADNASAWSTFYAGGTGSMQTLQPNVPYIVKELDNIGSGDVFSVIATITPTSDLLAYDYVWVSTPQSTITLPQCAHQSGYIQGTGPWYQCYLLVGGGTVSSPGTVELSALPYSFEWGNTTAQEVTISDQHSSNTWPYNFCAQYTVLYYAHNDTSSSQTLYHTFEHATNNTKPGAALGTSFLACPLNGTTTTARSVYTGSISPNSSAKQEFDIVYVGGYSTPAYFVLSTST